MSRKETNVNQTYDSVENECISLLSDHYGEGINGYALWADIPTGIKAWWLGIENTTDPPP